MTLDTNIVSTATEYFTRLGLEEKIDWDETGDTGLIPIKEFNMIEEIIALQVSFWCLRRLRNCCQSNSDTLHSILNKKIREYKLEFNKEFINDNSENIW